MNALAAWSQIAANIATVVAITSIWIGYKHWKSALRAQHEATALGIWKDYMQMALAHPELASPSRDLQSEDRRSAVFRSYEWFVSGMLFACEQIVALQPKDREWRESILDHLRIHRVYLTGSKFRPDRYSEALRQLIAVVTLDSLGPKAE